MRCFRIKLMKLTSLDGRMLHKSENRKAFCFAAFHFMVKEYSKRGRERKLILSFSSLERKQGGVKGSEIARSVRRRGWVGAEHGKHRS